MLYFVLTALLLISLLMIYVKSSYSLPYLKSSKTSINYEFDRNFYTKEEIKEKVDGLFNNIKYLYSEDEFDETTAGKSNMFTRIVIIDKNLSAAEYALTLAHELTHISKFTANERYCNFNAWKTLYESNDNYLKNVALRYADLDFKGLVNHQYSCAGYIEEYLQ